MAASYFSMADMQKVWENGGQDAYFAGASTPKGVTNVLVKGRKGNFFRTQMTNVGKVGRGAARGGEMALIQAANVAGKGVKATGSGVRTAGAFLGDKAQQLGSAIRSNPRTAGAVILGGTALTAGGAYAMSRQDRS